MSHADLPDAGRVSHFEIDLRLPTLAEKAVLGAFEGLANPTASVGLAAVNGVATTAIRSDGAPALDQGIVPTWTGLHTFEAAIAVETGAVGVKGVTVKAAAGQTANLQEWQDSGGNILSGVDERGILFADGNTDVTNSFFGTEAGISTATGIDNTGFGFRSLNSLTTGQNNTGLGRSTLTAVTTGDSNAAIGQDAGAKINTGHRNMCMGNRSGEKITSGIDNVAVGHLALSDCVTGGQNIAIGSEAAENVTGSGNVSIGYRTMELAVAVGNNVAIGLQALRNAAGSANVAIGYRAGYDETGSDKLYIHNTSGLPLIYGDFTSGSMKVEIADQGDLAGESLSEGDFATHADWDVTNDITDDVGNKAEYTWSANQASTLTQIAADLAIAGVGDRWYKFVYTVAVTTAPDGDCAATITVGFAAVAQTLAITAGIHTLYFKSKAVPGDFVISIVSGDDTVGQFSYDDLSLREVVGGDLVVHGDLQVNRDVGFYGTAPVAQQVGVPVTAAGVHAALVNLGLITA